MSLLSRLIALFRDDPVTFNVKGYSDRRGNSELAAHRALEQERQDQQLERIWRERVERNVAERQAGKRGAVVIPFYRPRVIRGRSK